MAAWADPVTDREARGLASGWAVVEAQAAQELVAEEPAGAVALARQEVAEGAPACGSQAGRAVAAARDQEPVVQVVEPEPVVESEPVEPERVVEPEPAAALVAGRAEVDLGVVGAEGPGSAGE